MPALADLGRAIKAACRVRHFSRRTAAVYVNWARRFVMFHGRRHPIELDAQAVIDFF